MSDQGSSQEEIRALTLLAGQMSRLQVDMDAFRSSLQEIRDVVVRIEAQDQKGKNAEILAKVAALEVRLSALEASAQRRAGANGLVEWLSRNAPLLLAAIVAIGLYLGWGGKR